MQVWSWISQLHDSQGESRKDLSYFAWPIPTNTAPRDTAAEKCQNKAKCHLAPLQTAHLTKSLRSIPLLCLSLLVF